MFFFGDQLSLIAATLSLTMISRARRLFSPQTSLSLLREACHLSLFDLKFVNKCEIVILGGYRLA